jgi:hypothetical protein
MWDHYRIITSRRRLRFRARSVCVCLLLEYLLYSCSRRERGIVEDMCYGRRRAEACVDGLVCPSRTSERGGEGDCVEEGGGGEGERERERALGLLLFHIPRH